MTSESWSERNQSYLASSIEKVRRLLESALAEVDTKQSNAQDKKVVDRESKLEKVSSYKNINNNQILPNSESETNDYSSVELPALETISTTFGLSEFEKSLLVLCAGVELNSEISKLCAKVHGNMNMAYPTFGLAFAILPKAHWSALSPASPLRKFKLIDLYGYPQMPLTECILRVEERILHYLIGISYLEKQLQGIIKPVQLKAPIVESHRRLAERIIYVWRKNNKTMTFRPYIQLSGTDKTSKLIVAQWACSMTGLFLWHLQVEFLPSKPEEMESLIQVWTRESALLGAGLYVSAEDMIDNAKQKSLEQLIEDIPGVLFVGTREMMSDSDLDRETILLDVKKPLKSEQRDLWKVCLGDKYGNELDGEISKLVNQFDLNAHCIQLASNESRLIGDKASPSSPSLYPCTLSSALWKSSRAATRPKLASLAQHILPKARMEDLVLPEKEKQLLQNIVVHVRNRTKVYEEWGFDTINGNRSRGLGITALFSGDSGTGKTMAAEALANELDLDLFQIDLAMVVSKYIGETEKNLRRIFDAAEDNAGSILFFDEADALFGKRTEVRDSHDRYANIEVGYLLQRMESYKGLAILTTNMKDSLDSAFMRRIRFVVNFPFPDERNRAEIWKRVFPKSMPKENLDIRLLANLSITGGQIYNIALNSAFLAADQGIPVNMNHIKESIRAEYDKLERPLTTIEFGD